MVWHLSFWDQWLTALTVLNDCLPVLVVLSVAVVVEVVDEVVAVVDELKSVVVGDGEGAVLHIS